MDNSINGSGAMSPDTTMAQSNGYHDAWASMSPYSQSPYNNSPMNEYGHWGGYLPHGLGTESLSTMPPPSHQPQAHQLIRPGPPPPMGHHQLPMLNTNPTWPSQLTNPTPSTSYSAPPLSMTPVASTPVVPPAEAAKPPPAPPLEKARKALSTEQKRAMCQYSEDNPGKRQADIGAKFGVERSTVSKVLRHKDQYLKRDQEPDTAAAKRAKGKHPDFDRTLSNYIKRQQSSGFDVKDEEVMEQAKLFARASDNQDGLLSSLTSGWLQKFKQRHGLGGGGGCGGGTNNGSNNRLTRRASETNIPDRARISARPPKLKKEKSTNAISRSKNKKERPSSIVSPTSPNGQMSPLSEGRSEEDAHPEGLGLDGLDFTYQPTASHSTTSLTNDTGNSSFSGGALSPTGTFTFSADPNTGTFPFENHREKRSNTFPSLNIDAVNQQAAASSAEPMTPRHAPSSATSSALESPARSMKAIISPIDTALTSPPVLRRSSSNSSLNTGGRSTAPSATTTAAGSNGTTNAASMDSSPVSPSQEDARRAANTLLSYIQSMSSNGQFDQGEYMTIVHLTKKLQVHQGPPAARPMGGLSRIPEGDGEMQTSHEVMMETS